MSVGFPRSDDGTGGGAFLAFDLLKSASQPAGASESSMSDFLGIAAAALGSETAWVDDEDDDERPE